MITLVKAYPYDVQVDYTKSFATKTEQAIFFNNLSHENVEETNYIKVNNSFNVALDYDYLDNEGVNYIIFDNGYRDIFAFIIKKEYLKENLTRIIYEVDPIQTYMFDITIQNSFVERKVCTINEVTDYDEGLTLGEYSIVSETVAFTKGETYFAMFNGIKNYEITISSDGVISHYAEMPASNSTPNTVIDGVTYPLYFIPLIDNYLPPGLRDHPSLVGIVRFPTCAYSTGNITINYIQKMDNYFSNGKPNYVQVGYVTTYAKDITKIIHTGAGGSVSKNEVTDFFPYTYYVLTDGEGDPLIMKPQELPSSITVKGKYALSHTPIERFYVEGFKGDTTGRTYNITNTNQMMLPTAKNEGMSYISANGGLMKMQRDNQVLQNTLNGIATVAGAIATDGASLLLGGVQDTVAGINQIRESDKRTQNMLLTPSSISSFGTPSTRNSFGTNDVRVLKYSVTEQVKTKIRNYIARFGNKYNNYATIDIKTYKGYVKFISPNIDSKIDSVHLDKIINILERGVYFE